LSSFTEQLVARTRRFSDEVDAIDFSFDGYVYNPLSYAWDIHEKYLLTYVHPHVDILFLGMNPGPFGMAQTGVPFGEVTAVSEWMRLDGVVEKPLREHPARPVKGFAVGRSEVSGRRLWGLMATRFGSAENFFTANAVMNYCPLVFMDGGKTARNVVPEKLVKAERDELDAVCDAYLDDIVALVAPKALVGIGKFATKRLERSAGRLGLSLPVVSILHPSPGNPQANRDWDGKVTLCLEEAGLW
jgi:single-strand selective monofunctional uracil DNA glycosylase